MVNECGYPHAFGTPGEYHWVDAFGSSLRGSIRVREPDGCDRQEGLARWQKQLGEGHLVMIAEGRAGAGGRSYAVADVLAAKGVPFAFCAGYSGVDDLPARATNALVPTKPLRAEQVALGLLRVKEDRLS